MQNFKVLLNYSTKNLVSDGENFFTVHTTVIQQTCSTLGVIQQPTHKPSNCNTKNKFQDYKYIKDHVMKSFHEVRFPITYLL
jgi:hypothetical protein